MSDLKIFQMFWPLKAPERVRQKPMEVLALGMPRTGTESLRVALEELGYKTYHGFNIGDAPEDCVAWASLHDRKLANDNAALDAAAFDRVLGDCQAVADTPSIVFTEQLVKAYPNAKVIANHRPDTEAWYRSIANVVERNAASLGIFKRALFLFSTHLFWIQISTMRTDIADFWRGDILGSARQVYKDQYEMLDGIVPKERMLYWSVQEGWEPLCDFLGKPVPDMPFPSKNNVDEHDKQLVAKLMPYVWVAVRNLVLFLAMLGVGIAYLWKWS